jgi:hypothetical protein
VLFINQTSMTGSRTMHRARRAPGADDKWEVSWLPGQHLSRTEAVTAMVLADTTAGQFVFERHWLWGHVQGWAEELGMSAPDALAQAAARPKQWAITPPERTDPDHDAERGDAEYSDAEYSDPEGAD